MELNDQNERSWYLAYKAITRELTQAEEEEWQELLQTDLELKTDFQHFKSLWEKAGSLPYGQINVKNDWEAVRGRVKSKGRFKPYYKYAAVVVIFMIAAITVWRNEVGTFFYDTQTVSTIIQAPTGSKSYVLLPDSSEVWLNAGSKITFDSQFGISNRKVILDGEAFFDVEKDEVPFQVFTSKYDVKVLGTAFNIRAYKDDNAVVTTLVRGSLSINNIITAKGRKSALLEPGDRLTLKKDSRTAIVEKGANVNLETSWKDGWLTISSESLGELAKKLERLYDVQISFEREELKNYRYTGKIKQLSLEQVLKALALTSPVKFDISEKTVTISLAESESKKYRSLKKSKN
ncbi:DUF4974 domain-containing protein [Fulvivirga maritima]|uniref:FecR family protein n=1 Tax=Fulvivirga maritima TaxID=2904247 RepID=UPI001F30D0A6|nr:FecR domain-containing protein [Fulvivirga maritima]UII27181.1 DUF4974 domain-containing protein [Fulvivirga maritima]